MSNQKKRIGITMEQHIVTQNVQHHHGSGYLKPGYTTETVEKERYYEVISLRDAVVIAWDGNGLKTIRLGDRLTEAQADAVARCLTFDVTIKA